MNKKAKITIDAQGNYTMDFIEGFSGSSCVEKSEQLKMILGGGTDKDTKHKDEYYQPENEQFNDIFNK